MTARRPTRIAGERRVTKAPTRPQPVEPPEQWWVGFVRHHRYTWPIEVLFTLALASVIAGVQLWVDGNRTDRQEVLANVTFIRETLRDNPDGSKNFRGMNLREADLSELDLGCDIKIHGLENRSKDPVFVERLNEASCADFSGADLTGARIDGTDLTGARLVDVILNNVEAGFVSAAGADIVPIEMDDVEFTLSDLRGATIAAGPGYSRGDAGTINLSLLAVDISGAQILGRGSVNTDDVIVRHVNLDGVAVYCQDGAVTETSQVITLADASCGNGFTTHLSNHLKPIDPQPSSD